MQPATDAAGEPVIVTIDTRSASIAARVWKLAVGRNTLLLLDSDVEGNRPEDRQLTARLYGGDDWMRIRQELLLGVGGVRALKALGISPSVAHLNEGHSAFAALELVRDRMVDRRHRRRGGHPPRRAADRLHDAHARAGRPRSVHAGADRGAPRPAARRARPVARRAAGAGPREPGQSRRDVLHDRAGPEAVAQGQRGLVAARPGVARDVDGPLSRRRRRARADRPHHQRRARADLAGAADAPDLRPASRARTGPSAAPSRTAGTTSKTSTTASCGRRIRR